MKLSLDTRGLTEVPADALIVGRHSDGSKLPPALAAVDRKLDGLLSKVMAAEKFEAKVGQVSHVHADGRLGAARVLVAGLGPKKESGAEAALNWFNSKCRMAGTMTKIVKEKLAEIGVPTLNVDVDLLDPSPAAEKRTKERIEGFLEQLSMGKTVAVK